MNQNEAVENQNGEMRRRFRFLVPILLGSVIPVFTGAAYLTGLTYHNTYLNEFGIPQNLFGKSAADYFLYAYQAATESGLRLIGLTGLVIMGMIIFIIYFWQAFDWLEKLVSQSQWMQSFRTKIRSKPRIYKLRKVVLVPFVVLIVGYLIFTVFILFLAPKMIGYQAGIIRADEDHIAFNTACKNTVASVRYCTEVYDGEKLVVRGFVIESSPNYISVIAAGVVKTLPVEGKEFVTDLKLIKK